MHGTEGNIYLICHISSAYEEKVAFFLYSVSFLCEKIVSYKIPPYRRYLEYSKSANKTRVKIHKKFLRLPYDLFLVYKKAAKI